MCILCHWACLLTYSFADLSIQPPHDHDHNNNRLSNFNEQEIEDVLSIATVKPVCNQVHSGPQASPLALM